MLRNLNSDMMWDFFIESCILMLVLFSPFIYGGVTITPLTFIEAFSFFLFFIFILRLLARERFKLVKLPALTFLLLFPLILFQLLPLTQGILSFISPTTVNLYREFRVGSHHNFTLSIYPEATVRMFLQLLSFAAIFFVVLNYFDSEKKIRRFLLALAICGFIYSIYGIIKKGPLEATAEFSTFTNKNHFAAYLEIIAFLTLSYVFIISLKSRQFILIFISSVLAVAIFLTASRAGRLCFLISLAVYILLLKMKRPVNKIASIIIPLFVFFFLFVIFIGSGSFIQRMETLKEPLHAYAARLQVVTDSLKIVKDFPLLGTGLGAFREIAQKYKTSDWQSTYAFSHNEPIQALVETGILGFMLLAIFFCNYFKNAYSAWRKRNSPFAVYITLGCLVSLFSAILHSFFDFMFHVPAVSILFFVILALALRVVYMKEPQSQSIIPQYEFVLRRSLRVGLILILSLLLFLGEYVVFRRYFAEKIFQKARETKITNAGIRGVLEYKRVLRDIDRAIMLNPLNSAYLNKKADFLAELALREDMQEELPIIEDFRDSDKLLHLAEKFYKKAVDLNPTRADYHLRLGWLYSVFGKADLTEREFKKAILLDPQNIKLRSYVEQYLSP